MGTSGHEPFENDTAADWAAFAVDADDEHAYFLRPIRLALTLFNESETPDNCYETCVRGEECVAAADAMAAFSGEGSTRVPYDVREYFEGCATPIFTVDDLQAALKAVVFLVERSAMRQNWLSTGVESWLWIDSMDDLRRRLERALEVRRMAN